MTILAFNISFILESLVIGILGSSIVALGVELWKKKEKRYHVSLSLDSSDVYAPHNKSDVSIKVNYKGMFVDNAIVIMHISITNYGQNDIMFTSHFSEAIKIQSKGYRFLSISAVDNKTKPICEIMEDGTATLLWDILKRGESLKISITALSEQPISIVVDRVDCYNNLSFDFRSDCIDTIAPYQEMTQQDERLWLSLNSSIVKYAYMIFISFLFLYFDMSFSSRYDLSYEGQSLKNATLLYTPLLKKYVLLSDSSATRIISKDDVLNINSMIPTNTVNAATTLSALLEMLILGILISSVGFITYNILLISRYKKAGRLVKNTVKMKLK